MLNGLVWNSRGVGDKGKRDFVCESASKYKLDFIGIQETMRQDFSESILHSIGGETPFNWTWTPSRGRSGGILLGINSDTLEVLETGRGEYFIRVLVLGKIEKLSWNLVVVYGDAQPTGKAKFLVELVHIVKNNHIPLCIAGDFNLTRRASDRNKPGGYNRWSEIFNAIIMQGELMEIQLSGRKYTWSNNQEDPTFALLDRVLVSPSWEENFPLVTVTALTRELSDHVPLLISTGEGLKIQKNFKFENCWFLRDDLEGIITKIWNQEVGGSTNLDRWQDRFGNVRKALKGWNINFESANRKLRKKLTAEIDELDKKSELNGLSLGDFNHLQQCRNDLNKILKEEEIKWLPRSREKELLEGDSNTKYYHSKANGRRRKNRIVSLHQDEGVIEGQENLKKYITDFYKKLFGRPDHTQIRLDTEGVGKIDENDSKNLTKKLALRI